MRLTRILLTTGVLASTLALTACSSSCTSINLPKGASQYSPTDKNINTLNGRVSVTQLKATHVNDFLKGDVLLKSSSSKDVPLKYKFTWLDKNGSPVGNDTPWQLGEAYSNGNAYISSQSTSTQATTYNVRVCNR